MLMHLHTALQRLMPETLSERRERTLHLVAAHLTSSLIRCATTSHRAKGVGSSPKPTMVSAPKRDAACACRSATPPDAAEGVGIARGCRRAKWPGRALRVAAEVGRGWWITLTPMPPAPSPPSAPPTPPSPSPQLTRPTTTPPPPPLARFAAPPSAVCARADGMLLGRRPAVRSRARRAAFVAAAARPVACAVGGARAAKAVHIGIPRWRQNNGRL